MATIVSGGEKVWRILNRYNVVDSGGGKKRFWVDERYGTYEANCEQWDFFDRTYRGGRDYKKSKHLFPFLNELASIREQRRGTSSQAGRGPLSARTSFDVRVDQAWRINISAAMVDELIGYLAAKPVGREALDSAAFKLLKSYVEDVDRNRTMKLDAFSLETARNLLVRGIDYEATDVGMTGEEIDEFYRLRGLPPPKRDKKGAVILRGLSREDRLTLGLLPYSYHVHPSNVVQARFDQAGNLLEVLLQEHVDAGLSLEELFKTKSEPLITRYRSWKRDRWALYEVHEQRGSNGVVARRELVELASDVNRIGTVPVVVSRYKKHDDDPARGISFLEDIAEVDRGLFNMWMALFWGLKEAASTLTVVNTGTLPSGNDKEKLQRAREIFQSALTQEVAVVNQEDKVTLLSKPFQQGSTLLEAATKLVSTLSMLSGFRDKADVQTLALSGVAFQRAFAALNSLLSRLGGILADAERSQLRVVAQFMGLDPALVTDDLSRYPTNFDLRSVDDLLVALEKLYAIKAPPEVMKRLLKDFVAKFLCDLDKATLDELFASIDAYEWSTADAALSALMNESNTRGTPEKGGGEPPMPPEDAMPHDGGGTPAKRQQRKKAA